MKNIIFASIAFLAFASCSNNDEIVSEPKLVSAKMTTEASESVTRAYLGHIDKGGSQTVIGVKFEIGDMMDVFEACSYSQGQKYIFTDKDHGDYQSANFYGEWTNDLGAWSAIFPSSNSNQMISMADDGNIYKTVVPSTQRTIISKDGGVTYEKEANVMVGARYFKEKKETPTCFLSPLVAYLYFASKNQEVDIVSEAGAICGTVQCVTSNNTWASWEDFRDCVTSISGTDATAMTIHSVGQYMERSKKYEHIVCFIPGHFNAGQFKIGDSFVNSKDHDLTHVNMYYFGIID